MQTSFYVARKRRAKKEKNKKTPTTTTTSSRKSARNFLFFRFYCIDLQISVWLFVCKRGPLVFVCSVNFTIFLSEKLKSMQECFLWNSLCGFCVRKGEKESWLCYTHRKSLKQCMCIHMTTTKATSRNRPLCHYIYTYKYYTCAYIRRRTHEPSSQRKTYTHTYKFRLFILDSKWSRTNNDQT